MAAGRALLIRGGGLGDFLLALPLLHALVARRPEVVLATRASYAELLASRGLRLPFLDVDGADVASLFHAPSERLLERLRGAVVYSFLPDPDGDLARRARAAGAVEVRSLAARPTRPPHFALRALDDAGLGAPASVLETSLLEGAGARKGSRLLWLHPGSGSAAKNAPFDEFRARALAWRGPLALSLGPADRGLARAAAELARETGAELVVEPTLPELAARLSGAAHYVGNDSGITHLAAALGVPTEALFVASDPAIWRPLGRDVRVVDLRPPGRGE
jgi:ADP-heptose:LPS heptosyltransferase